MAGTSPFAIRLMPEGKGDMETIPSKKRKVNPLPHKNFCRTTPYDQADKQTVDGLLRN